MADEGQQLVISRHGKPAAKLKAVRSELGGRILGTGRESVKFLAEDWDKPLTDEEANAFWEGRW